jgi:hypothetical protein
MNKVWLAGIATRYGRSNIHLNWTEALRGDARLTMMLKDTMGDRAARLTEEGRSKGSGAAAAD